MAEAAIPVDLFNPGQVFACLGFLEAADILLGDVEGTFDWNDKASPSFKMWSAGKENPIETVLTFLNNADVVVLSPHGIEGPWPDNHLARSAFPCAEREIKTSDGKGFSNAALPVELVWNGKSIPMDHWLERDYLQTCKLFAGKQIAAQLTRNMLLGDKTKNGALGLHDVFSDIQINEFRDPFSIVCPVGGRFGFDARGSWDAMRIGSSLDTQGALVRVSPHAEVLAVIGLENTRPEFLSTYQIRYAVWGSRLPLSLCRAALFSPERFLPKTEFRFFRTHLGEDKQYKKVFFAQEEFSS